MIFDRYISLIIDSIERHYSLTISQVHEQNKILQVEIGAIGKELKDRDALHERISELERENATLEESVEDAQEELASVSKKLEKEKEEITQLSKTSGDLERQVMKLTEELSEKNAILEECKKDLEKSEDGNVQKGAKILLLEQELRDIEKVRENTTQAHTEAMDRLLEAAKVYDKATVSMLNALLDKRSFVNERKAWEKAKEALRGWDTPKKKGRKKQS